MQGIELGVAHDVWNVIVEYLDAPSLYSFIQCSRWTRDLADTRLHWKQRNHNQYPRFFSNDLENSENDPKIQYKSLGGNINGHWSNYGIQFGENGEIFNFTYIISLYDCKITPNPFNNWKIQTFTGQSKNGSKLSGIKLGNYISFIQGWSSHFTSVLGYFDGKTNISGSWLDTFDQHGYFSVVRFTNDFDLPKSSIQRNTLLKNYTTFPFDKSVDISKPWKVIATGYSPFFIKWDPDHQPILTSFPLPIKDKEWIVAFGESDMNQETIRVLANQYNNILTLLFVKTHLESRSVLFNAILEISSSQASGLMHSNDNQVIGKIDIKLNVNL